MDEYPERVQRVGSGYHETSTYSHGRSGTNDYSTSALQIEKIVDSSGVEHRPQWTPDWVEVCAGVEMRKEGNEGFLRVHGSACPARVLFHQWSEYGSYDGYGPSKQTSKHYWVRYEA